MLITTIISATLALAGYFFKHYLDIISKERGLKEERYLELLEYAASYDSKDKKNQERFLVGFRKSILYASDDVIKSGHEFLTSMTQSTSGNDDRNEKLNKFFLSMRRDMFRMNIFKKTKLPSRYYKLFVIGR